MPGSWRRAFSREWRGAGKNTGCHRTGPEHLPNAGSGEAWGAAGPGTRRREVGGDGTFGQGWGLQDPRTTQSTRALGRCAPGADEGKAGMRPGRESTSWVRTLKSPGLEEGSEKGFKREEAAKGRGQGAASERLQPKGKRFRTHTVRPVYTWDGGRGAGILTPAATPGIGCGNGKQGAQV